MIQHDSSHQEYIEHLQAAVSVADRIITLQGMDRSGTLNIYPKHISETELRKASRKNPYLLRFDTVIERNTEGMLYAVPYIHKYRNAFKTMAARLKITVDRLPELPLVKYINAVIRYINTGKPVHYEHMLFTWLDLRDHPICPVFVCDETYADTRFGIKGSMDAALFQIDNQYTPDVQLNIEDWHAFLSTLSFPGSPKHFNDIHTRAYRTLAMGGNIKTSHLRAWNLPNDYKIRSKKGSHQIIIVENTLNTLENALLPLIRELFNKDIDTTAENHYRSGLFKTLAMHELGHNIGCFSGQEKLGWYNDVYEELKANIIPILWIMHDYRQSKLTREEMEASVHVYLALDIMDCLLARTTPSRESYALATRLQLNYLLDREAMVVDGHRFRIIWEKFDLEHRLLLEKVLRILNSGNPRHAKAMANVYGGLEPIESIISMIFPLPRC